MKNNRICLKYTYLRFAREKTYIIALESHQFIRNTFKFMTQQDIQTVLIIEVDWSLRKI